MAIVPCGAEIPGVPVAFKFFIFSGFMSRFGTAGSSGACVAVKREKRGICCSKKKKKKKKRDK